jgi:hypothetical protein
VAVLIRASFITALDVFFATALEEIDWPSCLKVMMGCRFSLLIWAVLAIMWVIFCISPLPCHNTAYWLKNPGVSRCVQTFD